jgi:mono/diheme cytochrome c family protein
VLAALVLAGCGQPDPARRPLRPSQIHDFSDLYKTNCAGCHGADGKMGPAPPLNDPLFLNIIPVAEVRDLIEKGRPG